jgi:hypothetical protein
LADSTDHYPDWSLAKHKLISIAREFVCIGTFGYSRVFRYLCGFIMFTSAIISRAFEFCLWMTLDGFP